MLPRDVLWYTLGAEQIYLHMPILIALQMLGVTTVWQQDYTFVVKVWIPGLPDHHQAPL
jgi:hypothetical protein